MRDDGSVILPGDRAIGWLSELLYRHDPVRLRSCGAPEDEYEPEAARILPELERLVREGRTDPGSIREVVYAVFEQMFNRSPQNPAFYSGVCGRITDPVYSDIASEIAERLSEAL
jgi:hypothetical protein